MGENITVMGIKGNTLTKDQPEEKHGRRKISGN
jgi:hypothetical protein